MKVFAHWMNVTCNTATLLNPAVSSNHVRGVSQDQTGPGHGPIQFIVEIPEETTWDEVVETWVLGCGVCVEDKTDGIGFKEKWPAEVRRQFDAGSGDRHKWSSLKR
jgi:hypothetical protein